MTLTWEQSCDREPEVRDMVRRMARGGLADASLNDHLTGCPSCQETIAVAKWMQQLASAPVGFSMKRPLEKICSISRG